MATELDQAYEHCQRVAKHQAKNFYYAFRTLPRRKRRAIYAAYAFCRHCDDIVDEAGTATDKKGRLELTRRHLDQRDDDQAESQVFAALHDAARTFGIPADYFRQVVDGVEMDLTWTRFQTFEELRAYCYKVASVVGLICIEVFGYSDPKAREYATDLGIAMQLTNILRDVKEDADRGRIYIPIEDMESFGYSERELLGRVVDSRFRDLMRFQSERARSYFDSGRRLIPLVEADSRACPSVLHGVYSAILSRIESSGFNVFDERIGLSTGQKLLLAARLWAGTLLPAVSLRRR